MSIESPIPPTFLPIEIELICHQSTNTVTEIEALIYHLMDLFISYLTPYSHTEWNLAFRKLPVLSFIKEILVDNKHLKQPPSL